MVQSCKDRIKNTISAELSCRDGFFGNSINNYVSYQSAVGYNLKPETLSNRIPEHLTMNSEAAWNYVSDTVSSYSNLNVFQKIWWRLTKPITLYLHLYNVLTLDKIYKSLDDNDVGASQTTYQSSVFPRLLNFWDRLFNNWRSYLDSFFMDERHRHTHQSSSSKVMIQSLDPEINRFINPVVEIEDNRSDLYISHKQILNSRLNEHPISFNGIVNEYERVFKCGVNYLMDLALSQSDDELDEKKQKIKKEVHQLWKQILIKIHPDKNLSNNEIATQTAQKTISYKTKIDKCFDQITSVTHQQPNLSDPSSLNEYFASRDSLMNHIIAQFRQIAVEVNSGIDELNTILDELNTGIDKLNTRLDELSAGIDELNTGIDEVINTRLSEVNTKVAEAKAKTEAELANLSSQMQELMRIKATRNIDASEREPAHRVLSPN